MATAPILFSWQAPEFRHYPKNTAWYITLAIVAALIIGFMLLQRDIFGAVCTFIFALFILIFSRQEPKIIDIKLTSEAIHLSDTAIPYKTIKHFWIVYNDSHQTLNIETTTYLNRTLIVQLGDQDPVAIREALLQLAPEHTETEATLAQRLMHRLKF